MTNRGNDRRQLFFEAPDYQAVLDSLGASLPKADVDLHAYHVMPNHLHLVLVPRSPGAVSAYLQRVLCCIACHHRTRTATVGMGHVFQRRFWSRVIGDAFGYLSALEYVEDNARRGGLVSRAEDWPWGSLWERVNGGRRLLAEPLVALPSDWTELVNQGQSDDVLAALRSLPKRGRPPNRPV